MMTFSKMIPAVWFAVCAIAVPMTAEAFIVASPSYVNFYDTIVGGVSFQQSFQIINEGTDDIRYLSISNSCVPNFDVQAYACVGGLRAHDSCTVYANFRPTREGFISCAVFVSSSAGSANVTLSGRGIKRRLTPQNL